MDIYFGYYLVVQKNFPVFLREVFLAKRFLESNDLFKCESFYNIIKGLCHLG